MFAAQHLPDVAGQDHRFGIDSSQQAHRQQPRHGSIRWRAGCGVASAPHG
ncbi:Uncharacterised protein [Mycobacterium tuberculosis]|nr:Uncharacterised protein [Mycobacterium tuberculosis]